MGKPTANKKKSMLFPLRRKLNNNGKSRNGIKYASAAMQGWRPEMEDRHHVLLSLPGRLSKWSFGAIFDGHGGKQMSRYCAKKLLNAIMKFLKPKFCLDADKSDAVRQENQKKIQDAIIQGFLDLDESMRLKIKDGSGSTAVCALISPTHVYLANCGDSRAVICRNNKVHFSTVDHKPMNREEKRRIKAAGGFVWRKRVLGGLALSRALGDYDYKKRADKGPCEQMVIPKPDVTVLERKKNSDEFIVLACDGIWDVMTNSELINFIKNEMVQTNDLAMVCNKVLDRCLEKHSHDNMSIVLITLPGCPSMNDLQLKRKVAMMEMRKRIRTRKTATEKNISTGETLDKIKAKAILSMNDKRVCKPPNAFICFYLDYRRRHGGNICRVAKLCGQKWRQMPNSERKKYFKRYRQAKRLKLVRNYNLRSSNKSLDRIPEISC